MSMPSSSYEVATRHGIRPAFRSSSIEHPLLARERAVVGARDLLLGELVQAQREPLGEAAVVDEDDRRAVLARRARGSPGRSTARSSGRSPRCPTSISTPSLTTGWESSFEVPSSRMSSTGTTTSRSSSLRVPASTSWIGRPPETKRPISSSGRCVAERPMRWTGRSSSASSRSTREREVGAALRAGDRVHLVEDQRLDAAQRLARLRGQHQVERLGRRDQDVGRLLAAARAAPSAACRRCARRRGASDSSPASGPRRLRSMS